jgi:RNA polymerase subunit RPABC4/transcription elongation factor Spt4
MTQAFAIPTSCAAGGCLHPPAFARVVLCQPEPADTRPSVGGSLEFVCTDHREGVPGSPKHGGSCVLVIGRDGLAPPLIPPGSILASEIRRQTLEAAMRVCRDVAYAHERHSEDLDAEVDEETSGHRQDGAAECAGLLEHLVKGEDLEGARLCVACGMVRPTGEACPFCDDRRALDLECVARPVADDPEPTPETVEAYNRDREAALSKERAEEARVAPVFLACAECQRIFAPDLKTCPACGSSNVNTARPSEDEVYNAGIEAAAVEAIEALVEAGEAPRAADSLAERLRALKWDGVERIKVVGLTPAAREAVPDRVKVLEGAMRQVLAYADGCGKNWNKWSSDTFYDECAAAGDGPCAFHVATRALLASASAPTCLGCGAQLAEVAGPEKGAHRFACLVAGCEHADEDLVAAGASELRDEAEKLLREDLPGEEPVPAGTPSTFRIDLAVAGVGHAVHEDGAFFDELVRNNPERFTPERDAAALADALGTGPGPDTRCPACGRVLVEIRGEAPTAIRIGKAWGCSSCYDSGAWDPPRPACLDAANHDCAASPHCSTCGQAHGPETSCNAEEARRARGT